MKISSVSWEIQWKIRKLFSVIDWKGREVFNQSAQNQVKLSSIKKRSKSSCRSQVGPCFCSISVRSVHLIWNFKHSKKESGSSYYHMFYAKGNERFDSWVAVELVQLLCTFQNSFNVCKIFDTLIWFRFSFRIAERYICKE